MHYNVHQPRAFHNRIARYLWVLVATALVATLGLPSAVQAQTTRHADRWFTRTARMPSMVSQASR